MFRLIRIISFWIFLGTFFLPLGSCSVDVVRENGKTSMMYRASDQPMAANTAETHLNVLKVVDFEKGEYGIGMVVTLLITFIFVNPPKYVAWLKPVAWFCLITLGLSCMMFAFYIQINPDKTVYGNLFIFSGAAYLATTVNAYLPRAIRFG